MTKVYELINYKACSISVVYLGVRIPVEFVAGRGSGPNDNATFTTSSRLVMDALENDERYGKMYRCVATHISEKDNPSTSSSSVQVAAKKGKRLSSAQKRALAQQNAVGMMEKPIDATIEPEATEEELVSQEAEEDQNPPAAPSPKVEKPKGTGKQSAKAQKPQQEGPVFKDPNEAFAFFVQKGEAVTSHSDLEALLKKYNAKISSEE